MIVIFVEFIDQLIDYSINRTGFYPGKKRATWKISTRLLNVLPSINKVDYYYYYYYRASLSLFVYCFSWCYCYCLAISVTSWISYFTVSDIAGFIILRYGGGVTGYIGYPCVCPCHRSVPPSVIGLPIRIFIPG